MIVILPNFHGIIERDNLKCDQVTLNPPNSICICFHVYTMINIHMVNLNLIVPQQFEMWIGLILANLILDFIKKIDMINCDAMINPNSIGLHGVLNLILDWLNQNYSHNLIAWFDLEQRTCTNLTRLGLILLLHF